MSKRRDPLPRLNIAPNINMQQPMGGPGQALYSPALPTSLQQSFHPSFPVANPLQTPMQGFFGQQIPGASGRPVHHAQQASIQLAAAGIHPPNFMTPVSGHFPRPSMMLGPGGQPQAPSHPFPNRNRRQLSIGGPPKAVLGGPARKVSPLPGGTASPSAPAAATPPPPTKAKKMIVNLPKETIPGEVGEPATRQSWARTPVADFAAYAEISVVPVEICTAEPYFSDSERYELPDSIDVYLPGKLAWDAIKKKAIEEKLEKLGVERGSGSNIPHIHAPHARAASISSPADPALLLFKLNKLQQAQETNSSNGSLPVSPQPPFVGHFGLSPSPSNQGPRFITNRHGHSMSLAQGPAYQPYSSSPSPFNPFGYNAVSGSESVADSQISDSSAEPIHMPQGRVPMTIPSFAPPLSAVGGNKSHIDFVRGFGLDVPLESEEEEAEEEAQQPIDNGQLESENENEDATFDMDSNRNQDGNMSEMDDGTTTVPQSRLHSRHVSKLSAALSLRSVGGNFQAQFQNAAVAAQQQVEEDQAGVDADQSGDEQEQIRPHNRLLDIDPVEEWTGSEDVYLGIETSDDESIGEWSNPSDEERARQQRVERRNRRRAQQVDQPRRLPDFPRPPESALGFLQRTDDDIISNPSEENLALGGRAEFLGVVTEEYYPDQHGHREASALDIPPHSRGASSQYSHSLHDPAMAHSRDASDNYVYPNSTQHISSSSLGRRESLNPFAKPFVFGAPRASTSGSWQPQYNEPSMPVPIPNMSTSGSGSFSGHSRLPSLGKPLNVAAPEFKPGNFNFRLPGAPQMPVPVPAFPEPEHHEEHVASVEASPYKVQGREKRQRHESSASIEEGDSMSSFKFPLKMDTSSPPSIRRHRSGSFTSSARNQTSESLPPFTFAGFSAVANNMPLVPKESDALDADIEKSLNNSGTVKADSTDVHGDNIVVPTPVKQKRAPIPLDFKHPVSSNTVPAGLFKALVSNEERTRRGVRSRLSSREIFEHSRRPSMDDDNVALIAHRNPRSRLVTDPGERPGLADDDDVFGSIRHVRRRSSLPDALHDDQYAASPSESSGVLVDPAARLSLQHFEAVIAELLDEKLGDLRQDLARNERKAEMGVSSTTESMMTDVISLFRTQLQESAIRSLDDSQMDARGELDFQMIKELVVEGHRELLAAFEREIHRVAQHIPATYATDGPENVVPVVEQVGNRTINAVVEAISELSARQEAFSVNAFAHEHDIIVDKLVNVLSPMIHSLHMDPIDYDFLTSQLTQSVKPHISQLIDLASDKRETAGLIVEKILPHLPSAKNMSVDTDAITMKLVAEVRQAIAPIDAFEIKEQVADLVVERLDSRLAVRDKAFNVDSVTSRVTESVSQLLEKLNTVPTTLLELATAQKAVDERQNSFTDSQARVTSSLIELPRQISSYFDEVKSLHSIILEKLEHQVPNVEPDANILVIKNIVEALSSDQNVIAEESQGSLVQSQLMLDKLNALPTEFSTLLSGLRESLTEVVVSRDNSRREMDELRKLNTEYQVQLAKARGNHGQVRVEKDVLAEKLAIVEADRDRLRLQIKELQAAASVNASGIHTLEARNAELEKALAKALARLQSADVVTQANQRNITDLEKSKEDLSTEKQDLKSKINSLEQEVGFVAREKHATSLALETLQSKHDALVSQQDNWKALNAATEKINMVFHLLENADSEEQKELRHYRDQSKVLENDKLALQKRNKELEAKLANSEKASATSRQTLSQAQQRSTEWERRAKDYEGQLEMVQTKLEQAEQTQSQLDADYQLVKMQLEEREADGRLQKDRESKLREQITALESKCVHLQGELEKANSTKRSSMASPVPFRPRTNGNNVTHTPSRPDSRASTIYDGRGNASSRRIPSYASSRNALTPESVVENSSVWDSMHAPKGENGQWRTSTIAAPFGRYSNFSPATPKAQPASLHIQYPRGPSPTPSTVSAAPTQGEDGWWS